MTGEYGGKSKFARKKVQTEEYKHMDDLFRSGAHFPSDNTLPGVCEACSKQVKPFDGRGHEVCRLGAEAAHRIYFRDHDKPLINEVGLDEKERMPTKKDKLMRSRSPTLRKTET